jgi:hypothetical protein
MRRSTSACSISAIRRMGCPHRGHESTSYSNTRRISAARDRLAGSGPARRLPPPASRSAACVRPTLGRLTMADAFAADAVTTCRLHASRARTPSITRAWTWTLRFSAAPNRCTMATAPQGPDRRRPVAHGSAGTRTPSAGRRPRPPGTDRRVPPGPRAKDTGRPLISGVGRTRRADFATFEAGERGDRCHADPGVFGRSACGRCPGLKPEATLKGRPTARRRP